MAATTKRYLDETGLITLISLIKQNIKNVAATKIQSIRYSDDTKKLEWTTNGTSYTGIDVSKWVSDIYLNTVTLSTSTGEIKFTLTNGNSKTINLNNWFNPNNYLTNTSASNTYLTKTAAADSYLSTSAAANSYINAIATLTTSEVENAWNTVTI